MKRTILIEILLIISFATLISLCINFFSLIANNVEYLDAAPQVSEIIWENIRTWSIYGALSILAALATLAAMIIIAIKDFPVFKPLLDKLNAKRDARKQAKAEKAEADKQARIEQLQAELDELKKDE